MRPFKRCAGFSRTAANAISRNLSGYMLSVQRRTRTRSGFNLPEVIKAAEADGDISYWLAGFYALQHNVDEALRWFRRAIEMGNENYPWFYNDPSMNNLRDEPGFQQTMEALRINWGQLSGSRSPESPTGREPGSAGVLPV